MLLPSGSIVHILQYIFKALFIYPSLNHSSFLFRFPSFLLLKDIDFVTCYFLTIIIIIITTAAVCYFFSSCPLEFWISFVLLLILVVKVLYPKSCRGPS